MRVAKGNERQIISKEDVDTIVEQYGYESEYIKCYKVKSASDGKTLGLLADYLKLEVSIDAKDEEKVLNFFIKNLPENEAKASMIQNVGIHERELVYYRFIKNLQVPTLKPWSVKFITSIGNAMVMEDLAALEYKMRDKYERLDKQHTLQALKTLARFHASTIIYEEKRSKDLLRPYRITEDHKQYLDSLFYSTNNSWFVQCREGTLEIVKTLSKKYNQNKETLRIIEDLWDDVWNDALNLCKLDEERCVLSHRDLWNNNLLFHYEKLDNGTIVPEDCVLVDFQMITCQPPAADIMQLLYANLDPQYRKENLTMFLNFYYDELTSCLSYNDIDIQSILTKGDFHASARKYKQWGIISFASLAPLIFGEDSIMEEIIEDSEQFNNMMTKRGNFIKEMMLESGRYSKIVMDILEEITDEYILK